MPALPIFGRHLTLLVALSLAATGAARADDAAPTSAPVRAQGEWYGDTVLEVDGVLIGSSLGCLRLTDWSGCLLPILGYPFGGPIIHARHRAAGRSSAARRDHRRPRPQLQPLHRRRLL
jgi:hypothetical protein